MEKREVKFPIFVRQVNHLEQGKGDGNVWSSETLWFGELVRIDETETTLLETTEFCKTPKEAWLKAIELTFPKHLQHLSEVHCSTTQRKPCEICHNMTNFYWKRSDGEMMFLCCLAHALEYDEMGGPPE